MPTHLLLRLTHEDDQTSDFRVQLLTTAVLPQTKAKITAVSTQQLTPSPWYYHNVHRENPRYYRGITAVPITVQLSNTKSSKMQ